MTTFEDLPNEVIYEMFDYLNICQAFESFFYLNTRFQYLLFDYPLLMKIDFSCLSKSLFEDCCTHILRPKINRILSLRLSNPLTIDFFHSFFSLDASFIQLESVVFTQINFQKLTPILISLSSLPRLYSLTITNNIEVSDSSEIYRLIFRLPVLKTCIITPKFYGGSLALSPATNTDSPIEYLSINRHCSVNQFVSLLSFTPQLSRISNFSLSETMNLNLTNRSMIYPKLTHISLKLWRMSFDSFKLLCSTFFSFAEVLSICTRADDHYLMSDRWEKLIESSMSRLRVFDFQHYWEPVDNDDIEQCTYHRLIDRFTSAFWIDRHWFFAHQHYYRRGIRDAVFYSADPYRRNLYELHERAHNDACPRRDRGLNFARRVNIDDYRAATNCPLQFPYATDLSLWGKGARGNFSFIADLSHMFHFSKLTHFSVQCPDFGLAQLTELLNDLPNVHSLILYTNTSYLSAEQAPPMDNTSSNRNRITTVAVRGRCTIEQIHVIMNLCPQVKCLEVEIDEEQLESILRYFFYDKTNPVQTDSLKTKSSFLKELDFFHRKFIHLFSRTTNKKLPSQDCFVNSKINQQTSNHGLCFLCFVNPQPTMELKLQRIMIKEKLLKDYSIESVINYLYLWW